MTALRTTVLTALSAALALSVAACGGTTQAGSAGPGTTATLPVETSSSAPADPAATPPSAPVTIGPSGAVVPPGVDLVPAGQVDASALPEYVQPRDVYSFDGGRSLQVFGMAADPCAGIEAAVIDQSADTVKIVLRPMMAPQGGSDVCTQVITAKPATVTLTEPLGKRTVYLAESR